MTEDPGEMCHAVQVTPHDARQKIRDARDMLSGTVPEWRGHHLGAEHIAHVRSELDAVRQEAQSVEAWLSQPTERQG